MFCAQHRCSRRGRDGTVRAGCGSTEERCVSSWDPACRGGVAWLPVLSQGTGRYRLGGVGSGAHLRAVAGVPSRSVAGRRTAKVSFLGLLAAARSLLHRARAALVSPCPSLRVPRMGKQEGNFHSCKPLRFSLQNQGRDGRKTLLRQPHDGSCCGFAQMPGLGLNSEGSGLLYGVAFGGGPGGGMSSAVRQGWRDQTGTRRTKAATVRDVGVGAG